jgi:sterol desaturase/sphingolipid hydroxylase (fatty acid hydroxylase superfamily)
VTDATTRTPRERVAGWAPDEPLRYPDIVTWPPRVRAMLRWLFGWPGYLWPWNLLYFGVALAAWYVATPSMSSMTSFSPGWIALILVRNLAIVVGWYGLFHVRLYTRRAQGNEFKFNGRGLSTSSLFAFGSQLKDNVFWSLASGVPIWTAYEVVTMWMFANGHIRWLSFDDNPVWFVGLMLLIPLGRGELHFYLIHRLIHWPPLYKRVHAVHHRNTNPGPWSGLSMHPFEHVAYFSGVLVHWIVASHPLHAMYNLVQTAMSPVPSHTGYGYFRIGGSKLSADGYAHYLHHKLFEVNYADGMLPLDRWFGSFHDGSPEADEAFKARRASRRASAAQAAP